MLNINKIEKLRKLKFRKQEDFVKKVGFSKQTYLDGLKRKEFKSGYLENIAKILEVTIDDLFIYDNSTYQINKGDNSQIVNDGKADYGNETEKLKKENRELKKEIKYLKEIVELLKLGK